MVSQGLWGHCQTCQPHVMGIPERKEQEKGAEEYLK